MILDPVYSVAKFSFYREAVQKSYLRAVGYLLYIGLVFSLISTIFVYIKLSPVIQQTAEWLGNSAPPITFADGKAMSALTAPLVLRHPGDHRLGILIDTNRTTPVTFEEMSKNNIVVSLTQNAFYLLNQQQNKLEERPLPAKMPKAITVDKDFYFKAAGYAGRVFYPALFLILCFFFPVWKFIASLFYSLFALLINAFVGSEVDYPGILKLSIYAQTPVILLHLVLLPIRRGPGSLSLFLLGLIITCTYLWQALRQIKNPA